MKTFPKIVYPTLATLAFAYLALLPMAQAVSPAPDGGYAGGNTAEGADALASLTLGIGNTAIGELALYLDYSGNYNTAIGDAALYNNLTGYNNTAIGYEALYGVGGFTSSSNNTATGYQALYQNTTGNYNTATGVNTLYSNTAGINNVASGANALYSNTAGTWNTAYGVNALYSNTTGASNVAIGANAGKSLTTGSGNVCIGVNVLGAAGESNTTRISNIYSSVASGRAVYVNADNKVGTLASSRRYKDEIKPMDKASEAILALKPVIFRYKKELDMGGARQFGLIAEDVEKVSPDLVTRDKEGKPETVRYEAVNAMLLNEFLKEHRKVEQQDRKIQDQDAAITQLKKDLEAVVAGLKKQATRIEKVSAQLELSRSAPQTAKNN